MSTTRTPAESLGRGRRPPKPARRLGASLVWSASLGGVVAWAIHLAAAWGSVEVSCRAGRDDAFGVPLRTFVAIATVVPLAIAAGALAAALWLRPRLSEERAGAQVLPARASRVRFVLEVGTWLDALAVMMILFGGIAVIWIGPCTS